MHSNVAPEAYRILQDVIYEIACWRLTTIIQTACIERGFNMNSTNDRPQAC